MDLPERVAIDAERAAVGRARREQVPVFIYRAGAVYYVRTRAEGAPPGATLLSEATPDGFLECRAPFVDGRCTCGVCHTCYKRAVDCRCKEVIDA